MKLEHKNINFDELQSEVESVIKFPLSNCKTREEAGFYLYNELPDLLEDIEISNITKKTSKDMLLNFKKKLVSIEPKAWDLLSAKITITMFVHYYLRKHY
jgi:hypothetical protein